MDPGVAVKAEMIGPVELTMVMITGALRTVTLLSVALTKSPTVPNVLPAVKFTAEPVPLIVPIAPSVRAHEYVVPEGQVPLHVGVAVKTCLPLVATVAVAGLTDTEARVTEMVISAELMIVTPLSVALTKSPTFPAVLPAVKVTEEPVEPLSVPIEPLVRAHANVVPEGQVLLHVVVVVKACPPPDATVAVAGLTVTAVSTDAVTVITVDDTLVIPPSVALT
jgi:hypothetical protein